MEELLEAIVDYLYYDPSRDPAIIPDNIPSKGKFYIGGYMGDIPRTLPYLSVRFGPTFPLSDSNAQWEKTAVFFTSHSTNPTISTKMIDFVKKLVFPDEIRGYMNVSNDRIANSSTTYKRRWMGQKADLVYDKNSDVWMDMLEVEMIWSSVACRTNPYDLPIAEYPDAQDERPYC